MSVYIPQSPVSGFSRTPAVRTTFPFSSFARCYSIFYESKIFVSHQNSTLGPGVGTGIHHFSIDFPTPPFRETQFKAFTTLAGAQEAAEGPADFSHTRRQFNGEWCGHVGVFTDNNNRKAAGKCIAFLADTGIQTPTGMDITTLGFHYVSSVATASDAPYILADIAGWSVALPDFVSRFLMLGGNPFFAAPVGLLYYLPLMSPAIRDWKNGPGFWTKVGAVKGYSAPADCFNERLGPSQEIVGLPVFGMAFQARRVVGK